MQQVANSPPWRGGAKRRGGLEADASACCNKTSPLTFRRDGGKIIKCE